MEKVKFIHSADLHLDSPFVGLHHLPPTILERIRESTFVALRRLVDQAIRHEVDFVLLAGDLYDGENRSLRAQSRLRREMERLQANRIAVYIIHGNHDHLGGNWIELTWPDNVFTFTKQEVTSMPFIKNGEQVATIYGFSYEEKAVGPSMVESYIHTNQQGFHIAMLHGSKEGESEHSRYAPFLVSDLIKRNMDYWALGHIHKREIVNELPAVVYPGNIQGRNPKETGERGCYLVELTKGNAELVFIPTADCIWKKEEILISSCETAEEVLQTIVQMMNQQREKGKGVFLSITLSSNQRKPFLTKELLEEMKGTVNDGEEEMESFVWLHRLQVKELFKVTMRSPFFMDLAETMKHYQRFDEATAPLLLQPKSRRFLQPYTDDEKENILEDARQLLLSYFSEEDENEN